MASDYMGIWVESWKDIKNIYQQKSAKWASRNEKSSSFSGLLSYTRGTR